jgi:hypothetical protein
MSWAKACKKAGITGLTFHDLRGSAVMRLALADATVPQIAMFRIANIALNDAMLLPYDANPGRTGFSERTRFCHWPAPGRLSDNKQ